MYNFIKKIENLNNSNNLYNNNLNKNTNLNKNIYTIITVIKNEQDFINQWLEYYIKMGIEFFYILIDNIVYTQKDYIINDEFKTKVKFININSEFCIKILSKKKFDYYYNTYKSGIIHSILNQFIQSLNIEWIILCSIDQYYYFNGKTIPEFLNTIDLDCSQILLPWYCIKNLDDLSSSNLLEIINKLYTTEHNHVSPIARCKYIKELEVSSHYFISKELYQKIFVGNKYIYVKDRFDIYKMFKFSMDNFRQYYNNDNFDKWNNGICFHFTIRNLNEILIKHIYSWSNNIPFKTKINIENILNKSYTNKECLRIYENKNNNRKININVNNLIKLNINNINNYYNKLINFILTNEEIDLNYQKYDELKSNLIKLVQE